MKVKALVVIAITIVLFLPQCRKCQTCVQQCVDCWHDSLRITKDTICSKNFANYQAFQDSLDKRTYKGCGFYGPQEKISSCKASDEQLYGAICY